MSTDDFHFVSAYAPSCKLLRRQSLHTLPDWTQSSSQKRGILTVTLNCLQLGKGIFMQEQSWQVADPAVVGHLGQQMRAGNVKLSWVVSYSAGWRVTNNFIVWKWCSPFPQHSCPCTYLLAGDSAQAIAGQLYPAVWESECSAVTTFTECCYYLAFS